MHAHDLEPVTPLTLAPPAAAGPVSGFAIVVGEHPEGGWQLEGGPAPGVARRAASCLLAPAIGDRVWVVGDADQGVYVVAVLERKSQDSAVLTFEGDATLRTAGQLTLDATRGVAIQTPAAVGVVADEVQVQARAGRAIFQELNVIARAVFASLRKVTRVGEVLELLVDRVTQRSKHSVRSIEGIDQTQAHSIDMRAQATAHIQATHALVNGKDLVKMDGGQIHLG